MAVVIRLTPYGRKNSPVYKIMVQEKGSPLTGKFLEKIGTYTSGKNTTPKFDLNADRYGHWVKLGAVPSERMAYLVKKNVPALLAAAPVATPAAAEAPVKKAAKPAAAPKAEKTAEKKAKPAAKAASKK